jgi:uncharacterized protein (TIGR03083 family)
MDREAIIRAESDAFARVLAETAGDAPVPTCPEWTADDLLWHLTEVQLFWAAVLGRDARTDADVEAIEQSQPARPTTSGDSLALRQRATAALLKQLGSLDDTLPRWSWFEKDQTVGFTRRMQTYEATMHRVDAELTAGRPISPIESDVAAGAVDHAVDVMWGGWMPDWAQYESRAVGEFVATDTGGRWLVEFGHWFGTGPESGKEFDEGMAFRAENGTPRVTVSAPVTDLALWSWVRGGSVEITGDAEGRAAVGAMITRGMP